MGNLETRIMFLIILLGALWLMLSEAGRAYIANFAAVISGNTVIPSGNTNAGRVTKTGTARTKKSIPVKDLIPAHKKAIPVKDLIPAHKYTYKGLLPVHKFLGGLYPAP